jgi:3-dehydroquinate synthase
MYALPSNIKITDDIGQTLSEYFDKSGFRNIGILVDSNTSVHCYPQLESHLDEHFTINIAAGEKHKDLSTCNGIWEEMTYHQMDRKSLLINLGGGVIGDMGGFCAATYKRGISFLNIPTTLLAQVDAAIGGKLGVDFQGFKNHIGVFKEPEMVLIYPDFLITLPTKELRSGFAEVIKHALIADGPYWFKIRSSSLDEQPWHEHIAHSVYTKHQIVTADPNENSIRKSLNFGHTVGHAIERHYLHEPDPLLHGEAIAIGMICEAYISTRKEGLATTHLNEISSYLLQIFGKVRIPDGELNAIAKNALQDKKNQDGHIVCTLLPDIGEVTYETTITLPEIEESLQFYGSLDASP